MTKAERIRQLRELHANFIASKPHQFFEGSPSYALHEGLSVDEARDTFRFVVGTFGALLSVETITDLSWNALSALFGQLQAVHNSLLQLRSSSNQNTWQNFAQNLDQCALHLRMYGVPSLVLGEGPVMSLRTSLEEERSKLATARTEMEALRDQVENLITPAVAGSLSQAFTARRDALFVGRRVWAVVAAGLAVATLVTTYFLAASIAGALAPTTSPANDLSAVLWSAALVRAAVLLPLFAVTAFAFAQYRKERDFEEEYAHKAAVAVSLPNYGDLAKEQSVKDQIVSAATAVIFTSPLQPSREAETTGKALREAKEVIQVLAKARPGR